MEFLCAQCGKSTVQILVDEKDKAPLEFCGWECVAKYAAIIVCQIYGSLRT